tara:strand:+ start:96 stop:299 length:204 start_codon:yes stop_codon:yes gene_type:complete
MVMETMVVQVVGQTELTQHQVQEQEFQDKVLQVVQVLLPFQEEEVEHQKQDKQQVIQHKVAMVLHLQ